MGLSRDDIPAQRLQIISSEVISYFGLIGSTPILNEIGEYNTDNNFF